MSTITLTAMAVAAVALIGAFMRLPDAWYCGLLALACMLGGAETAYREQTSLAIALLAAGALFAGGSLHAVIVGGRERRQR